MRKMIIGLVAGLTICLPLNAGKNVAPAQTEVLPIAPYGMYLGAGLGASFFGRDCPCADGSRIYDDTFGGIVRLGYDWNDFLGLEGRLMWLPWEKDFMSLLNGSLYLKPKYAVTDNLTVYGLAGYGRNRLSCDCPAHPHHKHFEWAPGLGFGGEYFFNKERYNGKRKGWSIWADVVNVMYDKDRFNFTDNVVSGGVNYHF
ncbi:outer membrane beta-barrel protein [Nitratifractor sp.]